ncbi:MAG: rhodanese-like domain-containing protein [Terracidiphilus sp.]|jgi:phage shock protein E
MNWITILILAVMVASAFLLRRSGLISPAEAAAHLKKGALIIDVRTVPEFNSGHLPGAINLPLGEIESTLPRRVKDKNQVLLLHCQAGGRSAEAKKKLIDLGYLNAFNLGSYNRAAQIVKAE